MSERTKSTAELEREAMVAERSRIDRAIENERKMQAEAEAAVEQAKTNHAAAQRESQRVEREVFAEVARRGLRSEREAPELAQRLSMASRAVGLADACISQARLNVDGSRARLRDLECDQRKLSHRFELSNGPATALPGELPPAPKWLGSR